MKGTTVTTTPNDTVSPRPTYGYAITGFKQIRGRDGYAFEGALTLNGKKVLTVLNSGEGGGNNYMPLTAGGFSTLSKDLEDLDRAANQWAAGTEHEGYVEVADLFVEYLIAIAELNRSRKWIIVLNDTDYFALGAADVLEAPGKVSLDSLLTDLTTHPRFAKRNARVWDKTTSTFRLAADLIAEKNA